jgi:5-methylcytosine-specific restriction protein A
VPILKPCPGPGCHALVASGRCPDHQREAQVRRGTTTERGYGSDWERLRAYKLATDTVCQIRTHCDAAVATEVDHIIPFRGVDDPLRLDLFNLQSACKRCNSAKTNRGG